jgi:hypothetical protein
MKHRILECLLVLVLTVCLGISPAGAVAPDSREGDWAYENMAGGIRLTALSR